MSHDSDVRERYFSMCAHARSRHACLWSHARMSSGSEAVYEQMVNRKRVAPYPCGTTIMVNHRRKCDPKRPGSFHSALLWVLPKRRLRMLPQMPRLTDCNRLTLVDKKIWAELPNPSRKSSPRLRPATQHKAKHDLGIVSPRSATRFSTWGPCPE